MRMYGIQWGSLALHVSLCPRKAVCVTIFSTVQWGSLAVAVGLCLHIAAQYVLLFLALAVNFAWFQILGSCILLL